MPSLAEVFVTVRPDTDKFGPELTKRIKSVDASKAAEDAGKKAGRGFSGGFGGFVKSGLLGPIAGAFAAVQVGGMFKDFIQGAREAQATSRVTAQIIQSTGGAANISADQVVKLAESMSLKNGIDDEVIQKGANLLLTFKNVRNEAGEGANVFDRATQAAVDLSAAGFGSVESASTMLGKALNDPVKGISALSRAGVTFTDQQKEQIKVLTQSGDVLGAQKIILDEVAGQVGGAAAASADPIDRLKSTFRVFAGTLEGPVLGAVDGLTNVLGGTVVPAVSTFLAQMKSGEGAGGAFASGMTTLKNAAVGAFGFFRDVVVPVMKAVGGFLIDNRGAVAALAAGFIALNGVMAAHAAVMAVQAAGGLAKYLLQTNLVQAATRAWTAVQWLLNAALSANPIGLVIAGLVALGVGLVVAYKKSETFRDIVNSAWASVKAGWNALIASVQALWNNVLRPTWDAVGAAATRLWSNVIQPALARIRAGWDAALAAVRGAWENVLKPTWNAVGAAVNHLWAGVIQPALTRVRNGWTVMVNAVRAVWAGVLSPVFDSVRNGIGRVADAFGTARTAIGRAFDGIRDAAKAPIRFVVQTVMNDALIGNFNKIAKFFGAKQIGTIGLPRGFATGGHVDGPGTGTSDSILARLSRGEFVVRASAAARNRELLEAINSGVPGFAGGGPVDWVKSNLKSAGGKIVDLTQEGVASVRSAAGKVLDIATNPMGFLREKVNSVIRQVGGSDFAGAARSAGSKLLDYAVEKVKALFDFSSAGTGGGAATPNGTRGMGPAAKKAAAAVRSTFGFTGPIGGYANRNIAGTNKLSKHALGKAIDVMTYRNIALGQRIANFFNASRAAFNVDNVIFNRRIWNRGAPGGKRYTGANPHIDHPHIDFFDDGGVARGLGYLPKRTLKPERVLSPQQTEAFDRLVRVLEQGGGPSREFHYHAAAGRSMPRDDWEDAIGRARLMGV